MEYNWKSLLHEYNIYDEGFVLPQVELSSSRESYCDDEIKNINHKFRIKFNKLVEKMDYDEFNIDWDRMAQLEIQIKKFISAYQNRIIKDKSNKFGKIRMEKYDDHTIIVHQTINNISKKKYHISMATHTNGTYQVEYFSLKIKNLTNWNSCATNSDDYYFCHRDFFCLYEINDINNFCVVTSDGHSAVETTDFSFGNSDGSGPDMECDVTNFIDIIGSMVKYYDEMLDYADGWNDGDEGGCGLKYNTASLLNDMNIYDDGFILSNVKMYKNRPSYCDSEIKNLDKNIKNNFTKTVSSLDLDKFYLDNDRIKHLSESFVQYLSKKMDEGIIEDNESRIIVKNNGKILTDIKMSSFTDGNYQLDYFNIFIESNDCHRFLFCLYQLADDDEKDKFWIVTCDSHPAIETGEFSYGNSDGSGPQLEVPEIDLTPQKLTKLMVKYYKEFVANKYH